jgi:hypothetical protein
MEFGDSYCLATVDIATQRELFHILYKDLVKFEDRTAQPEDCDKYNVSKDMEDAMCVAMDEQVSSRDQTGDPSSEQFTVIWHSNFVNASYPIDGDVSCAAHFRCFLPLAAASQNTEQAAKL